MRAASTGYSPRWRPTTPPAFRMTEDLRSDDTHNPAAGCPGRLPAPARGTRPVRWRAEPTQQVHPVRLPLGTRKPPLALLLPAPALRRRELPDVPHPPLEDGRDLRIRLPALLRLVGQHRRLHELPHHALERVVRALELGRVVDGARRARLAAEAAVHAFRHVDVEAGHDETAGGLVLRGVDHDAVDRAGALAGEAGGADLEVDLEHAAVTEGERILHAHARGEPVRVLHGVGL